MSFQNNLTICSDLLFKVERSYVGFLREVEQMKNNASTLFNTNFSNW